jgi:TatD DNase family protein
MPDVLQSMADAQVSGALCISTTLETFDAVHALAVNHPQLWATVGVHPDNEGVQEPSLQELLDGAARPRVVGIGETGLDYYYDKSDRDTQKRLFRMHIDVARETQLPLIIHTRDAEDDTHAILADELEKGHFPALIHCFTASAGFAEKVLALGLTISLSGIVTFKNAKELQAIAATIPEDRLLIETDSPFLAPVPHRGRVCEPAYVAATAAFIAQLRGTDVDHLTRLTTTNFFNLFTKARP